MLPKLLPNSVARSGTRRDYPTCLVENARRNGRPSPRHSMNDVQPEDADNDQIDRDDIIEDARDEEDQHPRDDRDNGFKMADAERHPGSS